MNHSCRLLVRWEKKAENDLAFVQLACAPPILPSARFSDKFHVAMSSNNDDIVSVRARWASERTAKVHPKPLSAPLPSGSVNVAAYGRSPPAASAAGAESLSM